jgi:hypothetical protein
MLYVKGKGFLDIAPPVVKGLIRETVHEVDADVLDAGIP